MPGKSQHDQFCEAVRVKFTEDMADASSPLMARFLAFAKQDIASRFAGIDGVKVGAFKGVTVLKGRGRQPHRVTIRWVGRDLSLVYRGSWRAAKKDIAKRITGAACHRSDISVFFMDEIRNSVFDLDEALAVSDELVDMTFRLPIETFGVPT